MGRVLVIDGGRSHCRAALVDGGTVRGYRERPGLPARLEAGPVTALVNELATSLIGTELVGTPPLGAGPLDAGPLDAGLDAACVGLAGILASGARAEVAERVARFLGVRTLVAGDVVIAHAGALGGRAGVVVAAGTGAVALGANSGGTARADGCGHLLGDAGSGYWIGRRGIDAALRAADGRGGSPLLARLAESHLGALSTLPARLTASDDAVAVVAAFAEHVAVAAYTGGDEVARAIWWEAAGELALTAAACARALTAGPAPGPIHQAARTALRRSGGTGALAVSGHAPLAVSWIGGLFDAPDELLLQPFLDRLAELLPEAAPVPPAGDPLTGAALLAGPDGPGLLAPLVHVAPPSTRDSRLCAR